MTQATSIGPCLTVPVIRAKVVTYAAARSQFSQQERP